MITPTALRRLTGHPQWLLWGYLGLIALAELLTSTRFPEAGLLFHAIILIVLLIHGALERDEQVRRLTLTLVLAPLIRLLSLSLPIGSFPQATWHPIISIPLLIAAWMIARQLHLKPRDLGLRMGNPLIQAMLISGGITLGALEYVILSQLPERQGQPGLLVAPSWTTFGLTTLSLFVFTGFTEEIIFRGMFQSLAMPVLRRWSLIYVSLLFGALHITYRSWFDFVFVTIVGLIFAYIVMWSDSILGVTLAHGLTNVMLLVVLPYIEQHSTSTVATLVYWCIWIGTGLWLIAFGMLMWRADVEGRLLLRDQAAMSDDDPNPTPNPAWLAVQHHFAALGPRVQRTGAWRQLESRGAIERFNRIPWSRFTPRVTLAFMLGGLFGILGSAGLLLAFGGGGNNVAVAPDATSVAVANPTPTTLGTPSAATPTTGAVAVVVPTPTTAGAAPTEAAVNATTGPAASAVATAVADQTTAPTAVLAASLPWPEQLPAGMSYSPTDSWPFRFVDLEQQGSPFLVFRGDNRWLVLRDQPANGHPVPLSAARGTVDVAGTQATLITYADEGRQLIWDRDGEKLQLSASGVSPDEMVAAASSLQSLEPAAFEARLREQTTGKPVGPSLLWPNVLPAGVLLQPVESLIEPVQEINAPAKVDGYVLVFSSATSRVTVGGGSIQAPPIEGDEEQVQWGRLTGRLITNDKTFLLRIDTPDTAGALPHLDVLQDGKPALLPPVQQGPFFVTADNISRGDFDRLIAGLQPITAAEFVPRSIGQDISSLTYMWLGSLPRGYAVVPDSVTFGWDDFLLQGGRPYFSVTAANDANDTITIKGGREASGAAFTIPEGDTTEQFFPTIRGQTATAALTSAGTIVIWSEDNVYYEISSPSLDVDTLASIAENLDRLEARGFYGNLR